MTPFFIKSCCAGAAGCSVSDRPAPADPGEHPESLVGEISQQTQRALTSAVQRRDLLSGVCDQGATSRGLRRRPCEQV